MFKSIAKALLPSILAVSMLVGCSAATTKTETPTATPSTVVATTTDPGVINIFTARHYETDDAIFKKFTDQTGIKINLVEGKAEELIERLKTEGDGTSADLFITVDGGVLTNAKNEGMLAPITDETILKNVPANYRDRENYWVGLSTRARIIVYAKDRVNSEDLSSYEDLASDKWIGKLLVRSSTHLYNQSLVASFIALYGEEKTEEIISDLVKNFARDPEGGDRDQAKAIVAGIGDVAIMNSYYVGLMANSADAEEKKVAENIGVFFPNQETTGTHINISGIGLVKASNNKENAIKLIQYLTDIESQEAFSNENYEYPVNPNAKVSELLKSWGGFKAQEIDFAVLANNNAKAVELTGKVGWK